MPTIYRAWCEACGRSPEPSGGVAGFVSLDGCMGGVILPEGYAAVQLANGELVCLPHPVEESTLRSNGFTWQRASREGRLFRVTFKICKSCGTFHEERHIHDGQAGCLPGLVGGALIIIPARFALKYSWPQSFFIGYLAMFAFWIVALSLFQVRWRKKNAQTKLRECRRCQAKEFMTVSQASRKPSVCPHCGTNHMRYQFAGKS